MAELERRQAQQQAELERQRRRVAELKNQQQKLIEARYADAISLDLLKTEQERIGRELAGAQQIIARYSTEVAAVLRTVDEALLLCADAHRLYLSAPPAIKRQLNLAVFTRFWVVDDRVQAADLAEPFAELLASGLPVNTVDSGDKADGHQADGNSQETPNPALDQQEPGLNITTLVELRGFEPLTPSMRTRCATGLRHSP